VTAAERAERTRTADELCAKAFAEAGCPDVGVALVAVGGYGRQELAPFSDLDIVLVHDPTIETGEWAGKIWYPLWDSGANIDHSVRTVDEVLEQAAADLRVALFTEKATGNDHAGLPLRPNTPRSGQSSSRAAGCAWEPVAAAAPAVGPHPVYRGEVWAADGGSG
jgi:hypothetical protein